MKALAFVGLLLAFATVSSAREFTGRNGKTIEAEIVSKTATEVELKLDSGKTVTVPLTSLSELDRIFVEAWESPEAAKAKLVAVDVDAALAAKGFVAFPVETREQFTVVKLELDGKEAAFMFNHSVEEPVLDQKAVERLGLTMKPLEGGGGGSVVGTVTPERFSNGSEDIDGTRILVAPVNGIPEGVDGLIGGQFFVDRSAKLDFASKKLWLESD